MTASPHPAGEPAYRRIAAQLRDRIASGDLAPGDRLPTEPEIALAERVSRETVRKALQVLIQEGLIVARRPIGYFVRKYERMDYWPLAEFAPHPADAMMDRYGTQITGEGRTPSQHIRVRVIRAAGQVAEQLQVPARSLVVVRERERHINDEAINIADSYFRLDDVQGSEIMDEADVARGTNRVLAELGLPLVGPADPRITARMPTPEEAARLGLRAGDTIPVMVHTRTGYTHGRRPVLYTVNVLPADRHEIRFEAAFAEGMWDL